MKTYKIKLVLEVYDNDINEEIIKDKLLSSFEDDNIFNKTFSITEIEC